MKLKQKLALGLSVFYLVCVIGVALSMHFCGGKLAEVSFYDNKTSCKFCKTEADNKMDDSCCKNTKIDVKVDDSHKTEASFKLPKIFDLDNFLPIRIAEFFQPILPSIFTELTYREPPKLTSVSKQVLHCVFRN